MKAILFTEPMFQAVVKNLKCQTRRVVKHPDYDFLGSSKPIIADDGVSVIFWDSSIACVVHPRYYPGETVYLKEPYIETTTLHEQIVAYKYDNPDVHFIGGWKNKMFMPEKYARHFVKIVNVRVERLMEITDVDAINEGVTTLDKHKLMPEIYDANGNRIYEDGKPKLGLTPKQQFERLWDSINVRWNRKHDDYKGFLFQDSPWVWVYEFELTQKP